MNCPAGILPRSRDRLRKGWIQYMRVKHILLVGAILLAAVLLTAGCAAPTSPTLVLVPTTTPSPTASIPTPEDNNAFGHWVKDMRVAYGGDIPCPDVGYQKNTYDLNKGTGADTPSIYACIERTADRNQSLLYLETDTVCNWDTTTIDGTANSISWGGQTINSVDGNLNNGTDGHKVYFCVQYPPKSGLGYGYNILGTNGNTVTSWSTWGNNNRIANLTFSSNIDCDGPGFAGWSRPEISLDLNEGAGGDFIYACILWDNQPIPPHG